jgi:hypothetical protein
MRKFIWTATMVVFFVPQIGGPASIQKLATALVPNRQDGGGGPKPAPDPGPKGLDAKFRFPDVHVSNH